MFVDGVAVAGVVVACFSWCCRLCLLLLLVFLAAVAVAGAVVVRACCW